MLSMHNDQFMQFTASVASFLQHENNSEIVFKISFTLIRTYSVDLRTRFERLL